MSKELGGNKKALIMLLMGLVLGMVLAAAVANPFAALTVPSGHQDVADKVQVTDQTLGVAYKAVFVYGGNTPALGIIPLDFASGSTYGFSKWEFRSDPGNAATAYASMSIYGPGSNGEYFCMVSRVSTDQMTVEYPNGSFEFQKSGNDGFVYFFYTP